MDALREAGIEPAATLFHWDLPQALQDAGGWLSRDTAARFADYATVVAEALGDRVGRWITLNEPVVVTWNGHVEGSHAPGLTLGTGAFPVAHHQLLGARPRGRRAAGGDRLGAGRASPTTTGPATRRPGREADVAAAAFRRRAAQPALHRPGAARAATRTRCSSWPADTVRPTATSTAISAPLDFLGVNYYFPELVRADPAAVFGMRDGAVAGPGPDRVRLAGRPGRADRDADVAEATATPTCRRSTSPRTAAAYDDVLGPDGAVHDPDRMSYLDSHLRAVRTAIDAGVDVRGYYCWSLLDNFEWAEGFSKRFGLVHVDFDTLARTPKDSYGWYRDVIAAQ